MGRVVGIEDPEQWLEDCPPRVFKQWLAHYEHSPFGDEQLLLARACSLLFLLAHRSYGKNTFESMDKLTKLFMPENWVGENRPAQPSINIDLESIKAFQRAMES